MRPDTGRSILVLAFLLLLAIAAPLRADDSPTQGASPASGILNADGCTAIVNPGQSIQAVVSVARSGQTICVRGGIYVEQVQFKPDNAGVTLVAYPGETPVIDGQGRLPLITYKNKYPGLIHITASNVIVDGFEVRNGTSRGVVIAQHPSMPAPLQGVIVRNLNIHDNQDNGVNVNGSTTFWVRNVLIEDNLVWRNLRRNAGTTYYGGAGMTFVQAESIIARGNRIYNNLGEGLAADRWTRNLTFEDNTTFDNLHANLYLNSTVNPLVRRNLIYCTDDRAYWLVKRSTVRAGVGLQIRDERFAKQTVKPPVSSGQVIINNIVVGCGLNFGVASQVAGGGLNNALVANNSFLNARGETGQNVDNVEFDGNASFKNSRFVNNIIAQYYPGTIARVLLSLGTPDFSTFTVANNLYSQAPSSRWFPQESGRIVAAPQLVDPVLPVKGVPLNAANFAIRSDSPAINRGLAQGQVTDDIFRGARDGAPDLGADELGGNTLFGLGEVDLTTAYAAP